LYQNLFDMDKKVFISLPIEDFQTVIIDCVNSCLENNKQEQTSTEQAEQLLTVQEAARLLHLTVPTIYSKHSKGELPNVCKRGKRLYFSKQSLIEWVKEGRKKSNAEIEQEAEAYLFNNKKGLK
jgi:excisionase family DNA binding protein